MGLMFMGPLVNPVTSSPSTDTLVSSRVVVNDSSSTWAQESLWLLTEQYTDGTVASTDDLVVKAADMTEFGTQIQSIQTYTASGCISVCALWLRVPPNKVTSGSNTWGVYKRTQSRSTASAIVVGDITALNMEVEFTSLTDYGGTPDGSGNFKAKVNDFINTGDPMVREIARGPVVRIWQVFATANDVTGGAAQAAGLYTSNWIIGFQNSSAAFDHAYWMPSTHMGDIANADPDVRKYDVDIRLGGSVIAGASTGWTQFSQQYLPYYSRSFLGNSSGLGWCSDESKRPPFRNTVPFAAWSSRTLRRLPPWAAQKYNGGSAIWTAPDLGIAQTIATSGGDQGKITLGDEAIRIWRAENGGNDKPGANWVRFEATSYPTNVVAGRAYCLGAVSSDKYYVYPTRLDAIAGTNKVIPSTGTISGGTGVVVYPAMAPMSLPSGFNYWPSTGERPNLGYGSTTAWVAVMQPAKGAMLALRTNALAMAYNPLIFRGTTTFRIPDIMTDSNTYAGLGTGFGSTFSQDPRFGGPHNNVAPTPHTGSGWYDEAKCDITPDSAHTPASDAMMAYLFEPWPYYIFDITVPFSLGVQTWELANDRNASWGGTPIPCTTMGGYFANIRGCAHLLKSVLAATLLPDSIVSGTFGEQAMFAAMKGSQTTQLTQFGIYTAANTPNSAAMGLLPMQLDWSFANWQYGAYFATTITIAESYWQGVVTSGVDYMVPYGKGLAGTITSPAVGNMTATQAGTYYVTGRSYVGTVSGYPDAYDATTNQWASWGVGFDNTQLTFNSTANTATFYCPDNLPSGTAVVANGDCITFLKRNASGALASPLAFGTLYYLKNVSGTTTITAELETAPGSGTIDITTTTFTNAGYSIHHVNAKSFGFWNVEFSNIYPVQNLAATYVLAWSRTGMNTPLTAANDALKNFTGVATEPALGYDSRYAYDAAICAE